MVDIENQIVEPSLNGWRRIKDFQHDPAITYYLVIPVGRSLDIARFRGGKFYEFEHDDWELDVLYYIPIPREPQEMIQWFYGQPNGYHLRTQPPWISTEEWDETLREEREARERLEKIAPVGSVVQFNNRALDKITRTGMIKHVWSGGFVVSVGEKEEWCVDEDEIVKTESRP